MTVEEFEKYPYVVGIQLGNITSGVSVAHKNDSLNILTLEWDSKSKVTQVPTSILYKDGDIKDKESARFGLEVDINKIDSNDIYLQHIKEYIYDTEHTDAMLKEKKSGLTAQMVISDYLKKLHDAAIVKLAKKLKKLNPKTEFSKEVCRYVVGCPVPQRDFMRECFIQAGIVTTGEAAYRLDFITQAEASAYNCIAWDRTTSNIGSGKHYLLCDIGHTSFAMSRITAATTESLSEVKFIAEHGGIGSKALEDNFKNYLDRLKLDSVTIERVMNEFSEDIKFSFDPSNDPSAIAISTISNTSNEPINVTYGELNEYVFLPIIEKMLQLILETDLAASENNEGRIVYEKIFLTGQYSTAPYLIQKLLEEPQYKKIAKLSNSIEYYANDSVSRGAVAYGFRKKQAQIPYFISQENAHAVIENDPIDKCAPTFNECDFIVGIDFGTTYSGSSYVRPPLDTDTELAPIKPIITEWPGQGQNNMVEKAPTMIIYNEKKNELTTTWGQQAKDKDLKDYEQLFGKFKLFLSPETVERHYGKGNDDIKDIQDKFSLGGVAAEQVIADYLKNFKTHVEKYITKHETKRRLLNIGSKKLTLSYVLTVPAMWDKEAKETMVSAAIKAGIVKKDQLHNLMIITEPEAAALYCERHFADFPKKDGMTFIVCDAGGGTVDLVTFRLSIDPTTGKEVIYQVGKGDGDTCGSTYLDDNFRKYILEFYDEITVQYDPIKLKLDRLMNEFIDDLKPNFKPCPNRDKYYQLSLPFYPNIPENWNTLGRTEEKNRVLKMPYRDMQEKVFDPIIRRIEELIDIQKDQMGRDEKIDIVLLVGGFSKSKYLQDRLKTRYEPDIKILHPANAVTAISQGAVSYAQKPRMISKTLVGQSYALEVKAKFDSSKEDDLAKKKKDAQGVEFSESRLEYFVLKDKKIDQDKVTAFERTVYIEYPNNAVIAIFSCNESAEYRYVDNKKHTKIMEINVDMPYLPSKKVNDKIEFKVRLQLDHIGVTVSVVCTDAEIGTTAGGTAEVNSLKYVRKSEPVVYRGKLSTKGFVLASN